ncbi:MAG: YlmC/YmxH family sporulation protein [Lachnospiraceae bacterium]|nr:YlmC/YmxH family sporulation protein [Lachnospiraceae bacterium]
MRICELREKEVINQCDCKRLGFVGDIEFDICTGCVTAIIVPGEPKLCGLFGRDTEFVIPFKCVVQIGEEIILVKVKEEDVLKKC